MQPACGSRSLGCRNLWKTGRPPYRFASYLIQFRLRAQHDEDSSHFSIKYSASLIYVTAASS